MQIIIDRSSDSSDYLSVLFLPVYSIQLHDDIEKKDAIDIQNINMDHEKCFSGGNLCAIVSKELLKQFSLSPIKSLKPYFGVILVQIGYELFQSIGQDNSLLKTERVTVSFLS